MMASASESEFESNSDSESNLKSLPLAVPVAARPGLFHWPRQMVYSTTA